MVACVPFQSSVNLGCPPAACQQHLQENTKDHFCHCLDYSRCLLTDCSTSVLQLAPFPFDLVCRELRRYPNAEVRPVCVLGPATCLSACLARGLDEALHCMILQLRH